MHRLPLALTTSLLLASVSAAQTLRHVRIDSPRAALLAAELEASGHDVVEGSLRAGSLELILSQPELEALAARGLEPELLAIGRPYAEIQREALAASPEAVPAGYSDLADIVARMNAAAAAHPTIAQVVDLTATYGAPLTHEGRHIMAIKISDNVAQDEDEPNVLIVSCHHAREIVTPEIALTAMENLVNGYGSNPTITAHVNANEIWIAPVWNPDGYEFVFNNDNLWRKNRRNNGGGIFGVDNNRNYDFGWSSACGGSTNPDSQTYRGPSAASEPETKTMVTFSNARRFAKVIDYHSSGEEVLWGYACLSHPFGNPYLKNEAIALTNASGYTDERSPTAEGEHFEWQLANFSSWSFLIETHTQFQPSFASAKAESNQLWGGILFALQRPTPLWGHVVDANSGLPVPASIRFLGVNWQNGEKNSSGGAFSRYYGALPPGNYNVEASANCYQTKVVPVTVTAGNSVQLDIALVPATLPTTYCTVKPSSIAGCVPAMGFSGTASASAGSGFMVTAGPTPGANAGLFLYTTNGAAGTPINNAFGWLCLTPGAGMFRIAAQNGGGISGTCSGQYTVDFNAYMATQIIDPNLIAGAGVDMQAWYRDPPNSGGANFSGAGHFVVCP